MGDSDGGGGDGGGMGESASNLKCKWCGQVPNDKGTIIHSQPLCHKNKKDEITYSVRKSLKSPQIKKVSENYENEMQDQRNIDRKDQYYDVLDHYIKNLRNLPVVKTFHISFVSDQIKQALLDKLKLDVSKEKIYNDLLKRLK